MSENDSENVIKTRSWCRDHGIIINNEQSNKKVKIDLEKCPIVKFYGKINYYSTFKEIIIVANEILSILQNNNEILFIGFDMEWPFSFQTGPDRTALIQICTNKRNCYLLHVYTIKQLPEIFLNLLAHDRIRLCGVNIKNDIHKLSRDFPNVPKDKIISNCIDSRTQAKEVYGGVSWWSMEKLVNHFLHMRIDKNKKIRMSQWNKIPLSADQIKYAAVDAYISLVLYQHLSSLQPQIISN